MGFEPTTTGITTEPLDTGIFKDQQFFMGFDGLRPTPLVSVFYILNSVSGLI